MNAERRTPRKIISGLLLCFACTAFADRQIEEATLDGRPVRIISNDKRALTIQSGRRQPGPTLDERPVNRGGHATIGGALKASRGL